MVTLFLGDIALSALIFSKIEGWTYLQGIYFIIVTFLTVGFGDFLPLKHASRVLLFPIAIFGIALLGSLIQVIVSYFDARSAARKATSRAAFERQRQIEEDKTQNPTDLKREIEFLERMNEHQDMWDQATEFVFSCLGFAAFWVVGAAIFQQLEVRHSFFSPCGCHRVCLSSSVLTSLLGLVLWDEHVLLLHLVPHDWIWGLCSTLSCWTRLVVCPTSFPPVH